MTLTAIIESLGKSFIVEVEIIEEGGFPRLTMSPRGWLKHRTSKLSLMPGVSARCPLKRFLLHRTLQAKVQNYHSYQLYWQNLERSKLFRSLVN